MSRSVVRATAVAVTAGAVSITAAGIVSATTSTPAVTGGDVAVTFTLESGQLADVCVAALTPVSYAPTLAATISGGNIAELASTLDDGNVLLLKSDSLPAATPSLLAPSVTVSATGVRPNVYALVTYCTSTGKPVINTVTVGDVAQAALGSVDSFSATGNQAMLSSALQNGLGR